MGHEEGEQCSHVYREVTRGTLPSSETKWSLPQCVQDLTLSGRQFDVLTYHQREVGLDVVKLELVADWRRMFLLDGRLDVQTLDEVSGESL